MNAEFKIVKAEEIIDEAQKLLYDGFHLMQQCATRTEGGYELVYTFGKALDVTQLKIVLAEDQSINSISSVFPCAFLYENEMHDLFGVDIKMISLDYKGTFYRTAIETPFK
ncbi:MAG: NADH-quinone oxidoreductase subunit C [Butyrivibrio sp.]|uniref:NADH-quinone oxidoreductase subunit C n=1 Tax=Butyrivibrio sp. NC2002 TaxID=1410610 RepID=UPI000565908C|nr:NADH-quinone oxidoreductase subunit C [Butyrivibrio sp. NC2002]MBE5860966.1 NADH-quinone oxidoreductase subunit C [Butyrivibrio sp.]